MTTSWRPETYCRNQTLRRVPCLFDAHTRICLTLLAIDLAALAAIILAGV